jgi:3-ketosteroid 9alpha-monooxygenase subunit B
MESTQGAEASLSTTDLSRLKRTFHALRVSRIIRETDDACSVVFEVPAELAEVFQYKPGQFLTLEVPYDGKTLKRCYSLASCPDTETEHKVTIKRVHEGRISNWVNDKLREGDSVRVLPPEGRFVMSREADEMVLFAGGSGITPIISIIKSALARTSRKIKLVYANRNAQSVIFRDELDALAAAHVGRLTVVHRYDNVDGFMRIADVGKLLSSRRDGEYFMCGPEGFMDAVERGLAAAGVPSDRVHIEKFVSPSDEPTGTNDSLPSDAVVPERIQVELQGKSYDLPYVAGKTLLKTAVDAGLDAPYSCEEGFCGCCAARLIEGTVHMSEDEALTAEEKKKGYVLTCQARPTSRSCSIKFLDL